MLNNNYLDTGPNVSTKLKNVFTKKLFLDAFSGDPCFNCSPNKDAALKARWNGGRKSVSGKTIFNSAVVLLFLSLAPVKAQDLITILDLESDGSVSSSTIQTICNKIHSELTKDKRFMTSDREYLPFMIENIEFKKPANCTDVQCLSEIGRQIGSRYIIGGAIRKVKDKVAITLNYVDTEKTTMIKSISTKTEMDKNEFITLKIPELVTDLLTPDSKTITPVTETPVTEKKSHRRAVVWITGTTVAAGAATAAILLLRNSGGPDGEEGELSISDIPIHIQR